MRSKSNVLEDAMEITKATTNQTEDVGTAPEGHRGMHSDLGANEERSELLGRPL